MGNDPTDRKRDTSHFDHERAARAAVKVTADKIALWNQDVALLRGFVVSGHLDASDKATSRRTCKRLTSDFENAEARLLADTPEGLRSHGRVRDMQRALLGLKVAVEEVIHRLDRDA